jgi:hypothetical protein
MMICRPEVSMTLPFALLIAATAAIGLLAGASLDQSIKQLPARHRIGDIAFSQYSRAADLGNGILFYGILGIGAALLNVAAAIAAYWQSVPSNRASLIYSGALFAVLHSFVTTQAAPIAHSQRKVPADDKGTLAALFDKFSRWQSIRCVLQLLNFGVNLWALIVYAQTS